MQPRISKTIVQNIIKQIDTHNRLIEEEECWRQHQNANSINNKSQPIPSKSSYGQAYMDDEESTRRCVYSGREDSSNIWMRKLESFEASSEDRWGHNGFKELYPKLFEDNRASEITIKRAHNYDGDTSDDSMNFNQRIKKKKSKHKCEKSLKYRKKDSKNFKYDYQHDEINRNEKESPKYKPKIIDKNINLKDVPASENEDYRFRSVSQDHKPKKHRPKNLNRTKKKLKSIHKKIKNKPKINEKNNHLKDSSTSENGDNRFRSVSQDQKPKKHRHKHLNRTLEELKSVYRKRKNKKKLKPSDSSDDKARETKSYSLELRSKNRKQKKCKYSSDPDEGTNSISPERLKRKHKSRKTLLKQERKGKHKHIHKKHKYSSDSDEEANSISPKRKKKKVPTATLR